MVEFSASLVDHRRQVEVVVLRNLDIATKASSSTIVKLPPWGVTARPVGHGAWSSAFLSSEASSAAASGPADFQSPTARLLLAVDSLCLRQNLLN